jgi:RNA 2',3'-cyclic 3'-phosphodiesterase
MAAAAVRLFTALWPTPRVREALAALAARWQWPGGAKPVDPARLHATLHFLGLVDVDRVPLLRPLLDVPLEPVTLHPETARQSVWPGGIAVLELDVPAELRAWHDHVAAALRAAGFDVEERAWRPHVTFARKASHARRAPACELPSWPVDDVALVRSTPGRGYEVLASFGGRPGGNAHGG